LGSVRAIAGIAPEVPAMFGSQRYAIGAAALIAVASTAMLSRRSHHRHAPTTPTSH